MTTTHSFSGCEINHGILFDLSINKFPCLVYGFHDKEFTALKETSTTYGYVYKGNAVLSYNKMSFPLSAGMYFSVPGVFQLTGGQGMLIEYLDHRGFFQIGGGIEETGRLNYIDGCTDSLLLSPIKFGDPCLNALYFPKNILQSPHTHPSYRVGIIVDGQGACVTPEGNILLNGGLIFIIHENGIHSFNTPSNSNMTVIAFHPDSDFGPKDIDHPMINRTFVEGASAKELFDIHTK